MATVDKKNEYTAKFLEYIEYLKKEKGIAYTKVSEKIGIPLYKIKNIKNSGSSADKEMIDDLIAAYPELRKGENELEFIPRKWPNLTDKQNKKTAVIQTELHEVLQYYKSELERKTKELEQERDRNNQEREFHQKEIEAYRKEKEDLMRLINKISANPSKV